MKSSVEAGRLLIAGLGPGNEACMSAQAMDEIHGAEVIAGYGPYVDLIPQEWLCGKIVITSGMRDEIGRCRAVMEHALAGKNTVLVCSGDPGVYALAGLVFELAEAWGISEILPIEVAPGIPAVCAAASLLGAPLTHDFACISLSDLLTPWELIERRVKAALMGEFVLAIYNPRSKKRNWQLERVMEHVRAVYGDKCVTGVVRQAYRSDQSAWCGTLDMMNAETIDMLSIVLFGNPSTRLIRGRMVTPRGYLGKYGPGTGPRASAG